MCDFKMVFVGESLPLSLWVSGRPRGNQMKFLNLEERKEKQLFQSRGLMSHKFNPPFSVHFKILGQLINIFLYQKQILFCFIFFLYNYAYMLLRQFVCWEMAQWQSYGKVFFLSLDLSLVGKLKEIFQDGVCHSDLRGRNFWKVCL